MTTGTRAAANPDPGSAGFPSMGQALGCLCCPGRERAEGIPAGMPQIPPRLIPAKFSAFSKQFPHLRINPLNATANQNKPENPSLHPQPDGKPLDASCPHLLSATGPGHHPHVTCEETPVSGAAGLVVAQGRQGTLTDLSQLCTVGTVS